MRLARFRRRNEATTGIAVVHDDALVEIAESWLEALVRCVGTTPERLTETGRSWPIDECVLLAPLPDQGRGIVCTGMNYFAHDAEARGLLQTQPTEQPIFFLKTASAMANPDAELCLDPAISEEFDWEVELGVVIGKPGRHIEPADVSRYVAGYTIVNDITGRDLQRLYGQWFIGKNVDASSPIGPWVTTLDEVGYPPVLQLRLSVNGEEKQNAKTTDMVFDVPILISTVSRTMALAPGDVFATGTPAGVGFARQPPEFLRPGDVVEAQIEGLGRLRNVVVTAEGATRPSGNRRGES